MKGSRRRAAAAVMLGSTAGGVIGAIQTLVLMPLYLREIGPTLYGAWCGSGDLLIWLQVFDLGIPNIMIQKIGAAHGRGDKDGIGVYLCSGLAMVSVVAVASLFAAVIIHRLVPVWMGVSGPAAVTLSHCFLIGAAATAMNIMSHGFHGLAKGIQETAFVNAATVVAAAVGFGVTAAMLVDGWGLYAIAWGLVARAAVALGANLWFWLSVLQRGLWAHFRIRGAVLREIAKLSPPVLFAGVGYGVMNNSQAAIAAITLGPNAATVLTVTRRAIDLARYFSDVVAYAAYGGYASLVATEEGRRRALRVRAEVVAVYMTIAVTLGTACMSINPSFVQVWVGAEQFGGAVLTVVLATGSLVSGWSFLSNYLYRATGKQAEGAWLLVGEAVIRLAAMVVGAYTFGLVGLAGVSIVTATLSGWLAYRGTVAYCGVAADTMNRWRMLSVYAFIWLAGIGLCYVLSVPSWIFVLGVGGAVVASTVMVLRLRDDLLRGVPLLGRRAEGDL